MSKIPHLLQNSWIYNLMDLQVIILAAGKGSRMKSQLPKVLHQIAGKPLVQHVIDNCSLMGASHCHMVVGHGSELVKDQDHN